MNNTTEYLVPTAYGEALLVEKRSKFIARVWPVESESDATVRLEAVRKQYWDATHNVYAYIIRNGPTRCSDDGEPQGTSGLPTLGVFQREEVFNVLCVVTRYYGGILLGAGGLVRAYSTAAKMGLDAAGISVVRQWGVMLIPTPYPLFEQVRNLVRRHRGVVASAEYGVDVLVEALLPMDAVHPCIADLAELSSGAIAAEVVDTVLRAAPRDGTINNE